MSFQDSGGPGSDPPGRDPSIAEAVQEISERAVLLVQEEIALAKAELSEKFNKLLMGTVVTATAAVFVFWAIAIILFGFAYLLNRYGPWADDQLFFGFFVVGAILLLLAVLGAYVAFRFFKAGSPPIPTMAIDEAQRIRESVMPSAGTAGDKLPYDPPVYKRAAGDEPEWPGEHDEIR